MKKLWIVPLLLTLAACDGRSADRQAVRSLEDFGSAVIATTPSGCKLWKVKDLTPGGTAWVYFAECGDTSWRTSNGKTSTDHRVGYGQVAQ